jgi:hypothetical protein
MRFGTVTTDAREKQNNRVISEPSRLIQLEIPEKHLAVCIKARPIMLVGWRVGGMVVAVRSPDGYASI